MSWIRLRQVALVAHDLDAVVDQLRSTFGLEVAHRDPAVAAFGLRNAVLPVGSEFVEVVSPTREGTAGGRQLARLGGDGGYMVICHTDDHDAVRARVDALGVRVALEAVDDDGYRLLQLHPRDTGGSFLEIDRQPGGEDPSGPWMPAGEGWQRAVRTQVVQGIAGVVVASPDRAATARRWSEIVDRPVVDDLLALDGATVRFVDGPVDALVEVVLRATPPITPVVIGGVRFSS